MLQVELKYSETGECQPISTPMYTHTHKQALLGPHDSMGAGTVWHENQCWELELCGMKVSVGSLNCVARKSSVGSCAKL